MDAVPDGKRFKNTDNLKKEPCLCFCLCDTLRAVNSHAEAEARKVRLWERRRFQWIQ